jgi:hypothetical protein
VPYRLWKGCPSSERRQAALGGCMRWLRGRNRPGGRKGKDSELVTLAWMLLLDEGAARVLANGRFPKGKPNPMGLGIPHDPVPRSAAPKKKRGTSTDAGTAVRPQGEELCHVKILGVLTACSGVPGSLWLRTESKNVTVGILDLHLIGPRTLDRCLKELDTLASIFDKEGVDIFHPDPDPCPKVPLGALTQHDGVPAPRHRCHVGALGISPIQLEAQNLCVEPETFRETGNPEDRHDALHLDIGGLPWFSTRHRRPLLSA